MKLVGDSVPSVEAFMQEYRVRSGSPRGSDGRTGADAVLVDGLHGCGAQA